MSSMSTNDTFITLGSSFRTDQEDSSSTIPLPMELDSISKKQNSLSSPVLQTTPARCPLAAITTVINNYMAPTVSSSSKRKRVINRPLGESLTSEAALAQVQEAETKRNKKVSLKKAPTNASLSKNK
ncbi:unnamed protein product [Sphagnum troendelagicum]|uniref:Uncharacterized protein n=1 Tax=Sphagnum troendelagicum TaxID=128251 RepID=A0ABP0T6Q0_9BRYO